MPEERERVDASLADLKAGIQLDAGKLFLLKLKGSRTEGRLDLQLVRASGAAAAGFEVELTLPDGTKVAGKTDSDGHFIAKDLPKSGDCKLQVPDVDEAAPAASTPTPAAGHLAYQKDLALPIGKPAVVELPPRVHRGELTGMHFETDKTFLLDSAMPGIRQLVTIYGSFGAESVLLVGHTDTVGPAEHNRGLSEERAASIAAFLTDDVDAWLANYKKPKSSTAWGLREDQHMLQTLTSKAGSPFYGATVDGLPGKATTDAFNLFQDENGLSRTGGPNEDTRRALIGKYMGLEGTTLPKDTKVVTHGCGFTHLAVQTGPGVANAENRRVEVFLFDGEVTPPPQTPCPDGGCPEHDQWIADTLTVVDLDQPLPGLDVQVQDENGQPLDGAAVHLAGPTPQDATSAGGGKASFPALVPGKYKAIASMDSASAADTEVEVVQGGARLQVTLTLQGQAELEVTLSLSAPQTAGKVSAQPAGKSATDPQDAAPKATFERLPLGACTLKASAPFHREKIDSVNLSRGKNSATVTLEPFGELSGTITDGTNPVDKAIVTLEGTASRSGNSDKGAFEFGNLPLGSYTLRIKKPQFEDFQQAVTITAQRTELKIQMVALTLDAFVRFEAWNLQTKAFEPVANMRADAVDDRTLGDKILGSGTTDSTGLVRLTARSADRKAGDSIDLKFFAHPGRVIGGVKFPDKWSTKGWLATDGTPGMRKDFKDATLGSAASPLVLRIGLDIHLRVTYQNGGTFNAVEGVELEISDVGKVVLDKVGEAHLVTFAVDGGDDVVIDVPGKISNAAIHLKPAQFNFDDAHLWKVIIGKQQSTSIGTQTAPKIIEGLSQRAAAMYIFKVLSEWSQFLTHVTAGDWDGIDNLDVFPTSMSGTAYSFPVGTLNIPQSDWFRRDTIAHELSHQIMWKLADISSGGIIGKILTGKLHLTHVEYLLTDDESHPLIEGWAEFIEILFNGGNIYAHARNLSRDPNTPPPGPIPLGPPPLSQGEHCEGAFANGLFLTLTRVAGGAATPAAIPESPDGNAFQAWMDDPNARALWKSCFWDPLKDMKSASPFSTRSFLTATKAHSPALWHKILPQIRDWNLMMDAPGIDAISPATAAAGDLLTITGREFQDIGTTVLFDGVPNGVVTVASSTSLQVTMPAGAAGPVKVVVSTSGGATHPQQMPSPPKQMTRR
jgi:outer membrane protein OmpA-like peptidoglycan-associated protein